ncbi:hypothetical protein KBC31_03000 [Candidatus Saccharibacteria bacterium]|nr:hypothetical protein [Candidatus Saccharibacteria bacterium]
MSENELNKHTLRKDVKINEAKAITNYKKAITGRTTFRFTLQLSLYFLVAFAVTWSAQITVFFYACKHGVEINNESLFFHF